jgi:hypothetical protein
MRAYFCGTRGSTPVSRQSQAHYGGYTSCIGLARASGPPTLVLDAGTGLQQLSAELDGVPFRGSLLLSHLHWDHTHGMPFFRGGMLGGHRVDVYLPEQGADPEELLERAISPPHFPIRPKQLGGGWTFRALKPGHYQIEGFSVQAAEIPHKGGRTFGYRVNDGSSAIAYLPDHSPLALGPGPEGAGEYHPAAVQLASDVDLLIHDAQHTAAELPRLAYLGHSAAEYRGRARTAVPGRHAGAVPPRPMADRRRDRPDRDRVRRGRRPGHRRVRRDGAGGAMKSAARDRRTKEP